jgi:hypothetical protein
MCNLLAIAHSIIEAFEAIEINESPSKRGLATLRAVSLLAWDGGVQFCARSAERLPGADVDEQRLLGG